MTSMMLAIGTAVLVGLTVVAVPPVEAAATVTVLRWGDGDTLDTNVGRVRLIGVDTPELGQCGATAAHQRAQRMAPAGTKIRLIDPRSVRDKDKYGRLLRYVEVVGKDVGLAQIKHGALARYDSRTGYDHHPRQTKYIRADKKHKSPCPNQGTGGKSSGGGSAAPAGNGRDCPASAPIKGNRGSNGWIYHQPWNQYYSVTVPEECFATAAAAEAAGYRAAKV